MQRMQKRMGKVNRRISQKVSKYISILHGDLNNFILLLRKGVYPYEDMDNWEKFDEITIPLKETFYSKLNLEGISDAEYAHAQKVWKVFRIKNCGEKSLLHSK